MWKVVIKIQQICKHKQAYISTTIYQDTAAKNTEKDIFCICNLGHYMPFKSVKGSVQIMKGHMQIQINILISNKQTNQQKQ